METVSLLIFSGLGHSRVGAGLGTGVCASVHICHVQRVAVLFFRWLWKIAPGRGPPGAVFKGEQHQDKRLHSFAGEEWAEDEWCQKLPEQYPEPREAVGKLSAPKPGAPSPLLLPLCCQALLGSFGHLRHPWVSLKGWPCMAQYSSH